jgi:hypothetical protein
MPSSCSLRKKGGMNNMGSARPYDHVYNSAQKKLSDAYKNLRDGFVPNQQGMGAFYRDVMAEFDEVNEIVSQLKSVAEQKAREWNSALSGENAYPTNTERRKRKTRKFVR